MKKLLWMVVAVATINTCLAGKSHAQFFRHRQPVNYSYQYTQQVYSSAQPAVSGDLATFTQWLNIVRAQYGLSAVILDVNLSNWAATNNEYQRSRGIGHFVMGAARRQNAALGGWPGASWLASPAHAAALLDPTITIIGIAYDGYYWTFNGS
jgi:uncharacterized protein YkwD